MVWGAKDKPVHHKEQTLFTKAWILFSLFNSKLWFPNTSIWKPSDLSRVSAKKTYCDKCSTLGETAGGRATILECLSDKAELDLFIFGDAI